LSPQYPGPCASCQQQRPLPDAAQPQVRDVAASGDVAQEAGAKKKKHVGPRVAATVIAAALTGLLIDCAVRKKRSWLARFMAATGRGFRSLFRWLKMPGRPPEAQKP
jgi:hypothetical protein